MASPEGVLGFWGFGVLGIGIGDEDQYFDYSVGLSTAAMGVDLSLAYIGTDVSSSDCPNLCDDTVVFSVSKSL